MVVFEDDLGEGARWSPPTRRGRPGGTEHLLGLGHATVHHIAGPTGWMSAEVRRDSRHATLTEAGADASAPLVGDWSADSGYDLGRRLAERPDVTVVLASNDQMALGEPRACTRRAAGFPTTSV